MTIETDYEAYRVACTSTPVFTLEEYKRYRSTGDAIIQWNKDVTEIAEWIRAQSSLLTMDQLADLFTQCFIDGEG